MHLIFLAPDWQEQGEPFSSDKRQDTVLFLQPIPGIHLQAKSQADVLKSIPQSSLIRQ